MFGLNHWAELYLAVVAAVLAAALFKMEHDDE